MVVVVCFRVCQQRCVLVLFILFGTVVLSRVLRKCRIVVFVRKSEKERLLFRALTNDSLLSLPGKMERHERGTDDQHTNDGPSEGG